MPGLGSLPPDVRTTYLGEFTQAHAERIVAGLEERGIAWWYKAPGYLSRIWEHGVRVFVDRERLDEAQALADEVLTGGPGPDRGAGPLT